jgi:hypothetical protein
MLFYGDITSVMMKRTSTVCLILLFEPVCPYHQNLAHPPDHGEMFFTYGGTTANILNKECELPQKGVAPHLVG